METTTGTTTKVVNLMKDDVRVLSHDGAHERTIAATGSVAAVATTYQDVRRLRLWGVDIAVQVRQTGLVVNLPPPAEETVYLVNSAVRLAVPDRDDVISPGQVVRDPDGRIRGCKSFVGN